MCIESFCFSCSPELLSWADSDSCCLRGRPRYAIQVFDPNRAPITCQGNWMQQFCLMSPGVGAVATVERKFGLFSPETYKVSVAAGQDVRYFCMQGMSSRVVAPCYSSLQPSVIATCVFFRLFSCFPWHAALTAFTTKWKLEGDGETDGSHPWCIILTCGDNITRTIVMNNAALLCRKLLRSSPQTARVVVHQSRQRGPDMEQRAISHFASKSHLLA